MADRGDRQVETERGHRPPDVRGEGVAVGAGPDAVGARERVARDRPLDRLDEHLGVRAAPVRDDLGHVAEPGAVRHVARRDHHRQVAVRAPADHLVHHVVVRVATLGGDPGVHREHAAPVEGAGRVDLHHRLPGGRRVGGDPGAGAVRRLPVLAELDLPAGDHQQRAPRAAARISARFPSTRSCIVLRSWRVCRGVGCRCRHVRIAGAVPSRRTIPGGARQGLPAAGLSRTPSTPERGTTLRA